MAGVSSGIIENRVHQATEATAARCRAAEAVHGECRSLAVDPHTVVVAYPALSQRARTP